MDGWQRNSTAPVCEQCHGMDCVKHVDCDLCDGEGYVVKKVHPVSGCNDVFQVCWKCSGAKHSVEFCFWF